MQFKYDPYKAGFVFIAHSHTDNELSDYLAKVLDENFCIFYDRSGKLGLKSLGLLIGETTIVDSVIPNADIFLFLISENSFKKNCKAYD
ncbi:MAG: hypothetical protein AAF655_23505, partial [Bacteroidota bacterium]